MEPPGEITAAGVKTAGPWSRPVGEFTRRAVKGPEPRPEPSAYLRPEITREAVKTSRDGHGGRARKARPSKARSFLYMQKLNSFETSGYIRI